MAFIFTAVNPRATQSLGGSCGVARTIAADPGVDTNAITALSAKQLVDRYAESLALDVPQRLIDAGERTHVQAAATIEAGAIHHCPMVFDLMRVLADQIICQFIDLRRDGGGTALQYRLAPAGNALIGVDFQEQPAGWHHIRRQLGDLHLG